MAKTYSLIPDCVLGKNIRDTSMKILWIELFSLVCFGDMDGLVRGQIRTTYEELSERTSLTVKQVRGRIDKLVSDGLLKKEATNRGIVLTIVDYDNIINGKGRHFCNRKSTVSIGCEGSEALSGKQEADERTCATVCISDPSENNFSDLGNEKGRQNEEINAQYISKRYKRDVVVREEDNSNNNFYCEEDYAHIVPKQEDFKNNVLSYIKIVKWEEYLNIPAFKSAIQKYLHKYGAWAGGRKLCYETIRGFTIEGSLRIWIQNEHGLNIC